MRPTIQHGPRISTHGELLSGLLVVVIVTWWAICAVVGATGGDLKEGPPRFTPVTPATCCEPVPFGASDG